MKNESLATSKIDTNQDSEIENRKIKLAIISSKICEIKNISRLLNEDEFEYFIDMIEILVRDKLVFLNYEYN